MCKHFPDAQVAVRTACCRKFYDCPQCHDEAEDHPLRKTLDLALVCKKCRKAFRKDLRDFDPETDSFCPHCDNQFVLENTAPSQPKAPAANPLAHLDARMIRDGDVKDEEFGFVNQSAKLDL